MVEIEDANKENVKKLKQWRKHFLAEKRDIKSYTFIPRGKQFEIWAAALMSAMTKFVKTITKITVM